MKITILTIVFLVISIQFNFAQILYGTNCYTVSSGDTPNVLFKYDYVTEKWNQVGVTGGTSIEAIALGPTSEIIYAVDGGTFGTINTNTASFKIIGNIGKANGDFGEIELNDIDGLTFDPVNKVMYGTHRINGNGPDTNDVLFQIDVSTGKVVPGAMLNSNNNPADYAIIEEVYESTLRDNVYDVDDIAYHVYTEELYAIQNYDGPSTITIINPKSGKLEHNLFDVNIKDIEGLTFSALGELYATTGDNGSPPNSFIHIDLNGLLTTTALNYIDPTGQNLDFESLDCITGRNDLALSMVLSNPAPSEPFYAGDDVTFSITIYNQGDFDNDSILITNYIPPGLILNDPNWALVAPGDIAETIITDPLEPGESVTVSITLKIDDYLSSCSITNAAEITSSFNSNIIDSIDDPVRLPDKDSKPDAQNSETNVVDNKINGGGPDVNEDDHDIAILKLPSETNYSDCVVLHLDNNQHI